MFTPAELENRSFVLIRRGFDPDEVGAFLRAVADDIRRLQDEVAAAKRAGDPVDAAMADAIAVVQAARESAARIEAQAQQRAVDRMKDAEDEVGRRLERTRVETEAQLNEAREQAVAIVAEANARKAAIEADITAAKNTWLREAAQLDILARRRQRLLEDAHESLEQWMTALRDIVDEARTGDADSVDERAQPADTNARVEPADAVYPDEPMTDMTADVPTQEASYDDESVIEHIDERMSYEGV